MAIEGIVTWWLPGKMGNQEGGQPGMAMRA